VPAEYIGAVMKLCTERRGQYFKSRLLSARTRVMMASEMPLAEIIFDFYDKLKSRRAATARWTTRSIGFEARNLVKVRILVSRRRGRRAVDDRATRQSPSARPQDA
jgi:GTP-binding protein LepA